MTQAPSARYSRGVLVLLLGRGRWSWLTQPDLEAISQTEPADIAAIVDGILKLQATRRRPPASSARARHARQRRLRARRVRGPRRHGDRAGSRAGRPARAAASTPAGQVSRRPSGSPTPTPTSTTTPSPTCARCRSRSSPPGGQRQDFSTNDLHDVPDQRRARVRDDGQGRHGADAWRRACGHCRSGTSCRSRERRSSARTAAPVAAPLSEAALLEHRPVPSRPDRRHQVLAHPVRRQPGGDLDRTDPNTLQDELVRHLETDSQMSCFDFALQFLDTESMTYWGRKRDANFWIENASVEWKESQAPFHTVARLTLLPSRSSPPATLRGVAHRRHRELHPGHDATRQHQPRAPACRGREP